MRLASRWIASVSMPIGVLAFWLGMSVAVLRFPSEYDWRYLTLSQLLYPERNPQGHLWASAALCACAFGGLLGSIAMRGERCVALYLLGTGYLIMIASSLLPERWFSIPHGHEILAIAAFVGVCSGLIGMWLRYLALTAGRSRSRDALLVGFVAMPITCAGLTQAYLSYARPQLPWVGLAWRALGVPLILSFALWEWITCALLSGCMAGMGYAYARLQRHPFENAARPGQYICACKNKASPLDATRGK
jgi:hypothetical protein